MGIDVSNSVSHGIHIDNAIDNQFFGVHTFTNGGDGIHLSSNANGHSFWFPYMENDNNGGVIDSGATENLVFGCRQGIDDDWALNDSGNDNLILGRTNAVNNQYTFQGNLGCEDLSIRPPAVGEDAYFTVSISGDSYSWGIDNSDGDRLEISYSASVKAVPGTTDRFSIDANGLIAIGPDSPVAGLTMSDDYLIARDANAGITAGTTQTQSGATALTAEVNEVSTCANAGDGVRLPVCVAGLKIVVINNGANALSVYPQGSADLGAGASTKMGTDLATTDMVTFTSYDSTNWRGVRGTYVT